MNANHLRGIHILFCITYFYSAMGQQNNVVVPYGHSDKVHDILFINDDKYVVTLSYRNAFLWDTRTGAFLRTLNDNSFTIAEGSINKYFAIESERSESIKIYSKKNAELIQTLTLSYPGNYDFPGTRLSFSSTEDSIIIVSLGKSKHRRVINVLSGKILFDNFSERDSWDFDSDPKQYEVKDTFYSKKKPFLKAVPTDTGAVFIYRPNEEQPVTLQRNYTVATALSFSEDDKLCAIGTDNGSLFLHDMVTGKMKQILNYDKRGISLCDISFDKRFVAATSYGGNIIIRDIQTGNIVQKLNNNNNLRSIRFDHTGKYLIGTTSIGRYEIRDNVDSTFLWNVESSALISEIKDSSELLNYVVISTERFGPDDPHKIYFNIPAGYITFDSSAQRFSFVIQIDTLKLQFRSLMLSYDGKWVSHFSSFEPLNTADKYQVSSYLKRYFGEQVKGVIEKNQIYMLDSLRKSIDCDYMSNNSNYYFLNKNNALKLYDANTNNYIREVLLLTH